MARTTRAAAAKAAQPTSEPQQLSSPPATPAPSSKSKRKGTQVKHESSTKTPTSNGKRSRRGIKKEDDEDDELPHNLKAPMLTPGAEDGEVQQDGSPPKKRAKLSGKGKKVEPTANDDVEAEESRTVKTEPTDTPKKSPKKKDNYGLTPGKTPYPDYARPTPEECVEVVRLLEKVHGKVTVPKAIPPPSLDVAGCGEVPSVLDALVRTRLSANTTNKNSSTAFQGLVARFGTLKEGIGKGSVDWDAVRRAPQREVFKAIERGGLADRKSRDIQAILQIAWDEQQERSEEALKKESQPGKKDNDEDKQREVTQVKQNIISFDHLHEMDTDAAIEKMLTLPGIGPKTASCVALFCLQRPSFAVDTHVFRLCRYLGWVPPSTRKGQPKVDRNTTYSHCDVRIPDQYKYPLHYLLIKHGKTCPRCRAVTGLSSAGWEEGCPIEHLVKRHGAKKGGASLKDRKKAAQAAAEKEEEGVEGEEVDEDMEESDAAYEE